MIKRMICAVVLLCLIASFTVSAEKGLSITPDGDFIIYAENGNPNEVAKILGMDKKEFLKTCDEKSIIYFAVNESKTKQIWITREKSKLADETVNLSDVEGKKINELMSDIMKNDSVSGVIVEKSRQKFIKTQASKSDSGGDYTIVQYITIAGKRNYTLSFFTSSSEDTFYIEKTFNSYEANDFYTDDKDDGTLVHTIPAVIVVLSLVAVVVLYTVIRDIRRSTKNKNSNDET